MWELVGCKGSRVKDSRTLPSSLYMGHFMKPYFKDKVTGVVSGTGSALVGEGGQALWEGAPVPTASVVSVGVVASLGFFRRVFPKLKLPGSGVKVQVSSPGRWQLTSLHREAPGAFPGDVARGQERGVLAAEVSPWLVAVPPPSSALVESLSSPCATGWCPEPFSRQRSRAGCPGPGLTREAGEWGPESWRGAQLGSIHIITGHSPTGTSCQRRHAGEGRPGHQGFRGAPGDQV